MITDEFPELLALASGRGGSNLPVNADAQGRPAAAQPPILGRRLLSRYASLKSGLHA
jgi:hypothetical protein